MSPGWIAALAGGILIGLASGALMLPLGQIAGVSGAFAKLLSQRDGGYWRVAFVTGLVFAGGAATVAGVWQPPAIGQPLPQVALAGLLVGAGATWANGCTSGHGVCGLSRLSRRSLVSVATFMAAGLATTFVLRHVGGLA